MAGLRRNVKTTNSSVSASNIERLQRKAMANLYTDEHGNKCFYVIKHVMVGNTGEMTEEYMTVGKAPVVMVAGKVDTEVQSLSVRKEKRDGSYHAAKPVKVGPCETYRLITGVVVVSFKNAEAKYEYARINGVQIDGEEYFPIAHSSSMDKKSKVFFSNLDAHVNFSIMNELTGGMLKVVLEAEGGQMNFVGLSKIDSRICLAATTPSLWPVAGRTGNIFYFNGSIESEDECATIPGIDNNYRDGYGVISDRVGSCMVEELAKEKVSLAQARRMSYQLRVRGVAGKGHFRAYSLHQRVAEIKAMLAIDISKCYCWIAGKAVDVRNLTDAELTKLAAQVDIIGDADAFKWGKYAIGMSHLTVEIGIVNMSNPTDGGMGSQIAFKLRDDEEEAIEYFKAITARQLVEAEAKRGKLAFSKDSLELSNSTYYNCMAVNPVAAEMDALLNHFRVKQLDTAVLNKVANLKQEINSNYFRMVPEDHLLNNRKEVLGSRMVDYVMPTGETVKVRALEVYSSEFERKYRELERLLDTFTTMTDKEKQVVLTNSRVATAIKSPSQGDNEFEMFFFVLLEEIVATPEYLQFIEECPANCIIIAQDNTMKHQLAGSDFDGDDLTVIYPELSEYDGKIIVGLVYNGKIINDYTSLVVRKRVRNGNVGQGAFIVYHKDEPVQAQEETEEAAVEEDVLNTLDFNKLF